MVADYYILYFIGCVLSVTVVAKTVIFIGKGINKETALNDLKSELDRYDVKLGDELSDK